MTYPKTITQMRSGETCSYARQIAPGLAYYTVDTTNAGIYVTAFSNGRAHEFKHGAIEVNSIYSYDCEGEMVPHPNKMSQGSTTKTETGTQYAGLVKNRVTGEYDCLFITEFSGLLARGRAIEHAKELGAEICDFVYDIQDIIIRQRSFKCVTTYEEWVPAQD